MADSQPRPSTQRFNDRVENYVKYRPDYPADVMKYLVEKTGLSKSFNVADIGSGTGIFTRHLLETGGDVYAVEPNEPMRKAADSTFNLLPNYHSIAGTAVETSLKDHIIDLIVCAQAFHWFNTPQTKAEFKRILTDAGYVALIWNNRSVDGDEFSKAYDLLLREKGSDYKEVNHQNLSKKDFDTFFRNGKYEKIVFTNAQVFDETGLIGRAASSSYVPSADTPEGKVFLEDLKEIFKQYHENGTIKFQYHTELYLGQI